eukprot:1182312-Pleurochrysis_carterae.AAC.2
MTSEKSKSKHLAQSEGRAMGTRKTASQEEVLLAAADVVGPLSDHAPVAAADVVESIVPGELEIRSSRRIPPVQARDWTNDSATGDTDIWKVTSEDQMQDPHVCFIRQSCTASKHDRKT